MREKLKYIVALLGVTLVWGMAFSPSLWLSPPAVSRAQSRIPRARFCPGTTVALRPAAGGTAATATANAQGVFEFRGLASGDYSAAVTVKGFAPYAGGVTIGAGQPQRLNIALAVANVSEDVQVTPTRRMLT